MSKIHPIRILQFICPTGFYGAERWILALAKNLPSEFVSCGLAVTLEDNTRNLELVRQYQALSIGETHEIPMAHRFDLGVIDKLVNLIKKNDIHIIHTHGYKSDILGVIAARKAGIKCVSTPHGFENARDLKLRLFIWLGVKAMKYAHAVAPLSPQLMNDVKAMGISEDKIHYIQNGVDLSEVQQQRLQPVTRSQKRRIGFIGQLISRKNVFDILEIFNELAKNDEKLELVIVGDGDQRAVLEEYAKELPSYNDIHFLGFRNDRLKLLQSFDLFVMTSTLEGIPRCLMEACAMGTPIAAYDIPGIDQLINHEKTGLLAPLGDKKTLSSYWMRLLNDTKSTKMLSNAAFEYVNTHYSAQRMSKEYLTLFQNLITEQKLK